MFPRSQIMLLPPKLNQVYLIKLLRHHVSNPLCLVCHLLVLDSRTPHPFHYKVLVMPSDGLMEEGSDSDGKCGPFIKSGVKKEEFHNMDEDTPKALVVAVAAPDIKGQDMAPGVPDTELMIDAVVIQVMKVIEL